MKKIILFVLSVMIISSAIKANEPQLKRPATATGESFMGVSVGPETVFSAIFPKISFYDFKQMKGYSTYYGLEGALSLTPLKTICADFVLGFKKEYFTIDNSLGAWWYPRFLTKDEGNGLEDSYFHLTLNPKVGFKYKFFWFKFGPSFILHSYYYDRKHSVVNFINLTKIGKFNSNFEILVQLQ